MTTDTGKLAQSTKTIQVLSADVNPWDMTSYSNPGLYYSLKANWYFFIKEGYAAPQGIPKDVFESIFVEVDPQQSVASTADGIKDEIFLKTVALLSGRAAEFKDL